MGARRGWCSAYEVLIEERSRFCMTCSWPFETRPTNPVDATSVNGEDASPGRSRPLVVK